jgi:hypothetical protein
MTCQKIFTWMEICLEFPCHIISTDDDGYAAQYVSHFFRFQRVSWWSSNAVNPNESSWYLVISCNFAIENGHWVRWFTHETWWFSTSQTLRQKRLRLLTDRQAATWVPLAIRWEPRGVAVDIQWPLPSGSQLKQARTSPTMMFPAINLHL